MSRSCHGRAGPWREAVFAEPTIDGTIALWRDALSQPLPYPAPITVPGSSLVEWTPPKRCGGCGKPLS